MSIINNNIKSLRMMYGETQEELGMILGLSKQCISNYENDRRDPSIEEITVIAKHYHIPIEQLLGQSIEVSEECEEFTMNKKYTQRVFNAMYPLFYSNKADQDPYFHKAFCFSNHIYDNLRNLEIPMYTMVNLCWKYYKLSWKKKQTIESIANLLGLIFLGCLSNLTDDEIRLNEVFVNRKSIDNEFIKKYYLCGKYAETINESKTLYVQEFHEEVMEYITVLKKNEKWGELGDYYLALRYIVGMIDNERNRDTNASIGYELMDSLMEVENPYATDYVAAILGYYHPKKEGKRNVYNVD